MSRPTPFGVIFTSESCPVEVAARCARPAESTVLACASLTCRVRMVAGAWSGSIFRYGARHP